MPAFGEQKCSTGASQGWDDAGRIIRDCGGARSIWSSALHLFQRTCCLGLFEGLLDHPPHPPQLAKPGNEFHVAGHLVSRPLLFPSQQVYNPSPPRHVTNLCPSIGSSALTLASSMFAFVSWAVKQRMKMISRIFPSKLL